ncbi:MAG: Asp23/Gls24 family envelope stress response protein [Acidaminobacteraceae bacterium]
MKVYALVGKSGTGKSHRAMKVAFEKHINYIIDDGLLIEGTKKVAGKSAKREDTKIAAVKRAIFFYHDHKAEISGILKENDEKSVLLIGTSVRMVEQICENLELGKIDEFVFIEDIATSEEIDNAIMQRMIYGKHVIPLPAVELKRDFSGYFIDTLKSVLGRRGNMDTIGEKSVVRPTYSYMGRFTISNKTITQIIEMAVIPLNAMYRVGKIRIHKKNEGVFIEVDVVFTYGGNIVETAESIQIAIKKEVEHMTNINVLSVDVHIKSIQLNVNKI